jgi:hypothetical protein
MNQIKLQLVARNLVPAAYLRYALKCSLQEWQRKRKGVFPHLLKQAIVREYAVASGAHVFVDTGTYYGFMLQACVRYFDRLISIEVEPHFYDRARRTLKKYKNVSVLYGDSAEVLPGVLAEIECPCLFWLDAHFSGGLTGKGASDTPVRRELEAILGHPYRHTVLIDDASCFDGTHDYPHLTWIERAALASRYRISVADNIIRLVPF